MTATLTRVSETDRVLASMLTENTGRHMLDSGGAYGRNWERNAGRDAEDFLAAPALTLDVRFDYIDVTIDVFHWLRERVEFDPAMQRKFELYVAMRDEPDDPWLVEAEAFAEAHERKYGRSDWAGCINTYNHESLLSQTLQYVIFQGPDGDDYIALQIHGGCDVRGGYTKPKIFRVMGYDGVSELYNDNAYELYCDGPVSPQDETLPGMDAMQADPHTLSYRGEWITYEGSFTRDPWEDAGVEMIHEDEETGDKFLRCPYCTDPRPMSVYPYPCG